MPDLEQTNQLPPQPLEGTLCYSPWALLLYKKHYYLAYAVPSHVYRWYATHSYNDKSVKSAGFTYHSFHDGEMYIDDASEITMIDPRTYDPVKLRKCQGYESAVEYFGMSDEDVLPKLAWEYWEQACERCDGLGFEISYSSMAALTPFPPPPDTDESMANGDIDLPQASRLTSMARKGTRPPPPVHVGMGEHRKESRCRDCAGTGMRGKGAQQTQGKNARN